MGLGELVGRAHVEQDQLAAPHLAQQLRPVLGAPLAAGHGQPAQRVLQLEQPLLGECAQLHPEVGDPGAGEAVDHLAAPAFGLDQARGAPRSHSVQDGASPSSAPSRTASRTAATWGQPGS